MSHPITAFLDDESIKQLEDEASEKNKSVAELIGELIKQYLARKNYEKKAIREALEEADKGIFVSSESMEKWFLSLGTDNELVRPKPDVFLNQ